MQVYALAEWRNAHRPDGLKGPAGEVIPKRIITKAPTAEEREHDFLWRIRKALPTPGKIGIFDRSHYEDVLVQRVEQFAPPEEIEKAIEFFRTKEKPCL